MQITKLGKMFILLALPPTVSLSIRKLSTFHGYASIEHTVCKKNFIEIIYGIGMSLNLSLFAAVLCPFLDRV
jgi:hypothetical protein